ncbi:hypothetical protein K5B43_004694 [Vibrio parahaemolyticus]|uniref:hypothetical protein n=1 Tax=Vibrio TaxID=662 RepID=UPI000363652E|nr:MULTISPECIES: hypothetical protein [Vibrio]EHT4943611.1 hypothetical protein [Vibrio vulnificus]EHY9861343.1 hypothetical protein [Vibrio parahaemolyticus]EKL9962058.1 hypothetical protein [Vibrio parahaemolyticus]ELB2005139.1 hypothetical protein [Vibrio parahaemolyticus]MBE3902165.1 hypothetical protein [Vibrio parahaemolyticus]
MSKNSSYNLFKIELPVERRDQFDVTIGLESYLITRYPKSLWYSEDKNAILLDIPDSVEDFYETVQSLTKLPSGGFKATLIEIDESHLDLEEIDWFDERYEVRKELVSSLFPVLIEQLKKPRLHMISLSR